MWRRRVREGVERHGTAYLEAFQREVERAAWRNANVTPGDAINYVMVKKLCKGFAQDALDSQHLQNNNNNNNNNNPQQGDDDFYYYEIDLKALTSLESYNLEKDSRIFTTLEDILDHRKCRSFVLIKTRAPPRRTIVTRPRNWVEAVRRCCGGFGNVRWCSNLREVEKSMGQLAGAVNYSNILTDFEAANPGTDLTFVLLNSYFWQRRESAAAVNRYGAIHTRAFVTRMSFEMTGANLKKSAQAGDVDELEENYARLMFQQPPLIGTNFPGFEILDDEFHDVGGEGRDVSVLGKSHGKETGEFAPKDRVVLAAPVVREIRGNDAVEVSHRVDTHES